RTINRGCSAGNTDGFCCAEADTPDRRRDAGMRISWRLVATLFRRRLGRLLLPLLRLLLAFGGIRLRHGLENRLAWIADRALQLGREVLGDIRSAEEQQDEAGVHDASVDTFARKPAAIARLVHHSDFHPPAIPVDAADS